MRYLLLVNGLSYLFREDNGRLLHFESNAPKGVEDGLADRLLSTGRFTEIPVEDMFSVGEAEISVKFTGTIGDAVVTSNCMAALMRKGYSVIGIVSPSYRALVSKICPGSVIKDWTATGRGLKHINLATAARTPGEGFAWECGIAHALGFSKYPEPPEKIQFAHHEMFKLNKLLERNSQNKMAVLHLWSNHSRSKSYSPEKVPLLIEGLNSLGYACVLIGGADEPKYNVECFDMRGTCNLVESSAVLSFADVVISVDSWVWHMAKLLHKPQVVLFGSLRCEGKPQPWERVEVLRGDLCKGKNCNVYSCRKSKCIDSIRVDAILSKVESLSLVERKVEVA